MHERQFFRCERTQQKNELTGWALASHSLRPKLMTARVQKAAFRHSNDFLSAIASYAGYVLPCFATGLPCSSLIFP